MKKHLCAVLLLAASMFTARAQQTPHLFFDHLDIKKGLPEGTVKNIIEDREGYLWFSTQNGLVRYDGYHNKVYQLGTSKTHRIETTNVQSLLLDAKDNLWVSTLANGVFKYNRATDTFQEFSYPEKNIFSQFNVGIDDREGNIWGTYYTSTRAAMGKLNVRTGKYELYKSDTQIPTTHFTRPIRSANGDIWFGSNNGLHRYSFAQKKVVSYFKEADTAKIRGANPVYEAPSQPGIIWTNTFHGNNVDLRISRLDAATGQITEYKPGHAPGDINDAGINDFYEDKQKQLWISTRLGLAMLDRTTGKFTNFVPKNIATPNMPEKWSFKDLAVTPDGNFWMTSTGSLSYFDTHTHDFRFYQANDNDPGSISNTDIASKIIDRSGSLWLGLFHSGVNHLNKQKSAFQQVNTIATKPDSYPGGTGIIQADANNTALITTIKGVYRWTVGTNHFEKIYGVPGEFIYTSRKVNDDELYISTQTGLVIKNLTSGALQRYTPNPVDSTALPSNQIGIVREDHNGIIWLSTLDNKGVCSFDPETKKFTRYPYRQNLEPVTPKNKRWLDDLRVLSIFEDDQNNLMIGTNYGGINQFHRDSKDFTSSFDRDGSKPKNLYCINSIYQDTQGRIWAGTYLSGLFIFDPKQNTYTKQFNEQSGLLYNTVSCITQDLAGNIWTIGERGLARINPVTLALKNFPAEQFIPGADISSSFNGIDRTTDGHLIVALKNGLAYFDPKELNDNPVAPTVHIEGIAYSNPRDSKGEVTNVLGYGKTEIELPYNQNRIEFNYIGLQYDNAENNTYAYQMEGYDKQWIQAGTNRTVTYTNLPPGTYTFKVMAANSSGVWNKTGASIKIVIHWPWWFTWWSWLIYITVFVLIVYAFIRYRSRQLLLEKQELEEKVAERTHQLSEQQEEITAQRDQLAETVDQLKSTQNQLIQSEKMASLGELTAGIAHEIQNPLNFVNNFAEVSAELLDEMEGEMDRGDMDEARAIASDVKQNLEKIRHHGKRADGIVKGMLQHSRTGNTTKESTDLNKLADEYLRLAYHGLRAKDKSFNAELVTHFDEDLPAVSILPQEVGRVLLNLFTNAFYAVQQKEKKGKGKYKPTVEVATRLDTPPTGEKWAEIIVKDNGTGIPEAIKDKIMQPFFTTKPTGEGTGLGLSLSYDIIVKGHGGKINIDTKEGEYTEFTILLPIGKKK